MTPSQHQRIDDTFRRYADRLVALAHTRLSPKMRRRLDGQDILQSVFRSFLRRLDTGAIVDPQDDLWPLLAAITLNKVGEKVRFHLAAKRSVEREGGQSYSLSHEHSDTANDAIERMLADREPSSAEVVAAADELYGLLSKFEPLARRAIELRLRHFTFAEIAAELGRNERTIRRWLAEAQSHLDERTDQAYNRPSRRRPQPSFMWPENVPQLNARDYLIERLIATGGICKVYAAVDRRDGSRVCMKVLRKQHRYLDELAARLANEAALVRRLNHAGIVPIHGLGQLPDGGPFMIMELIDGGNLAQQARRGAKADQLIRDLIRISDALSFVHESGIVHCDLKPENILCAADGRVLLTDFGFSRLCKATPTISATNAAPMHQTNRLTQQPKIGDDDCLVAGTTGYLAPEQIDPRFGPISPRTDVYAFGVLLYWCHTLFTPSGEASVESRLHALNGRGELPVAIERPAGMPENIFAVCECCLRALPSDRYPSVAIFVRSLAS